MVPPLLTDVVAPAAAVVLLLLLPLLQALNAIAATATSVAATANRLPCPIDAPIRPTACCGFLTLAGLL